MTQRLPIRDSVNATYATFFKAPVPLALFALLPFAGLCLLFVFAIWATNRMVEGETAWRFAILTAALLEAAIFVFSLGMLVAGAAHLLRSGRFPVAKTIGATLRRLPSLTLASLHILLPFALLIYGLFMPGAGPYWLLAYLLACIVDVTWLAFVTVASRVENRSPIASFSRSIALSRGNLWPLFAAAFLALLPISLATGFLKGIVPGWIGAMTPLLAGGFDMAALSILSVVAFERLRAAPDELGEVFG